MGNIFDYTQAELTEWLGKQGIQPFRARQIFKWLYVHQATSFDQMTDIAKPLRTILSEEFHMGAMTIVEKQSSQDNTCKYLFELEDGSHIEAVRIPQKDRFTLCVSSQVGCAMDCQFCLTAKSGLTRNLTMAEILGQIRHVRLDMLQENIDPVKLVNIVFMGMGEPLANYRNLLRSLSVITDSDFGMKFSPKRVTVSTCGLIPKMIQLGQDSTVNLAVSLNGVTDEVRTSLMPINKRYSLSQLLEACKKVKLKPRNKITFEYILIKGINDRDQDARQLVRILTPIRAKVNVIPFNEHPGSAFQRPSAQRIHDFVQILLDKGMTAIVRKSKGDDILAACGQLRAQRQS